MNSGEMNKLNIYGFVLLVTVVTIATVALKPIITHENEYMVIVANTSEHVISSVVISGAGGNSGKLGPIQPGMLRHYIFTPSEDGVLEYLIIQSEHEIQGTINADLKKGDTGEIYVVIGEMYQVKIQDELGI